MAAARAVIEATRPVLGVSAAVFRDGRVLLAERANAPLQGLWSLPGGRVEAGETLREAAARELFEEVGVTAEILGFLAPVEIVRRSPAGVLQAHFVVLPFAARWLSGQPAAGTEAAAVRWADPATLDGLPVTDGLQAVVDEATRLLAEAGS